MVSRSAKTFTFDYIHRRNGDIIAVIYTDLFGRDERGRLRHITVGFVKPGDDLEAKKASAQKFITDMSWQNLGYSLSRWGEKSDLIHGGLEQLILCVKDHYELKNTRPVHVALRG
jgi:hypothetical protein